MCTSITSHLISSKDLLSTLRIQKSGVVHCVLNKSQRMSSYLSSMQCNLDSVWTFPLLSYPFLSLFTNFSTSSLNVKKTCNSWEKALNIDKLLKQQMLRRGTGTGLQALRTVWVGSLPPVLTLGDHVKLPGREISSQGGGLENITHVFSVIKRAVFYFCLLYVLSPERYKRKCC